MDNFCDNCPDRSQCKKICPELQKHLREDIEVAQQYKLDCDLKSNIEEVIEETEWPEGVLQLDQKTWAYLIRKCKMTKKQRSCFYDYYCKGLSYNQIAKKNMTSRQNILITIDLTKKKIKNILTIS